MSISIQIEPKTGLAVCTCSGILTIDDAINGAKSLWKTPGWLGKAAVWNFLEARFDMSSPEVEQVARFILHHQPVEGPLKMAFVAQSDLEYGLSRMFEVYRQDHQTKFRVFRDLEEALNWARIFEPDNV